MKQEGVYKILTEFCHTGLQKCFTVTQPNPTERVGVFFWIYSITSSAFSAKYLKDFLHNQIIITIN